MNDELRPCPFCGGTEIETYDYVGPVIHEFVIAFSGCGAKFENESTEENIAAWNRRPSSIDIEGIARGIGERIATMTDEVYAASVKRARRTGEPVTFGADAEIMAAAAADILRRTLTYEEKS